MKFNIVRVFDFDDTLATSKGFIRVLHFERGKPSDTVAWLEAMGINGRPGPLGSIEISTESYADYAKEIEYLVGEGSLVVQKPGTGIKNFSTDVVDYSGVSKLIAPKPIENVIEIARKSYQRGERLGIITGRSGGSSIIDITGTETKINNASSIKRFLRRMGIEILPEDIHCVGDIPGGVPQNKARIMKDYFVEKYNPETIVYYDDDHRNLASVRSVDPRIIVIDAKKIGSGWGTVDSIIEAGKNRRRRVSDWSRAIKTSGVGF